jgi:hypothetical protein
MKNRAIWKDPKIARKRFARAATIFWVFLPYIIIIKTLFRYVDLVTLGMFFGIIGFASSKAYDEIKLRAFSLQLMTWVFIVIFFGVAGMVQYILREFSWATHADESVIQSGLLLIYFYIAMYELGAKSKVKARKIPKVFDKVLTYKIDTSSLFVISMTVISIALILYQITVSGWSGLLSRSTTTGAFSFGSSSTSLLFSSIVKNMTLYGFVISFCQRNRMKNIRLLLILQFICLVLINSPFSMARFNVAIVYIGLLLILVPGLHNRYYFFMIFVVGFIVIFPMLDLLRRDSLMSISFNSVLNVINTTVANLLSGHFDAFAMVISTVQFVKEFGITYGMQLLGVLLFFVPRSVWPSKPTGSGYLVFLKKGEQFKNVSSPLVAEGYINFGFAGVLAFGWIIGKFSRYFDDKYWGFQDDIRDKFIQIIYPFALSMFFFMNRGDLLTSFAYSISHILVFSSLFYINRQLRNIKNSDVLQEIQN